MWTAVVGVGARRVESELDRAAGGDVAGIPGTISGGGGVDHRAGVGPGQRRARRHRDAHRRERVVGGIDAALKSSVQALGIDPPPWLTDLDRRTGERGLPMPRELRW